MKKVSKSVSFFRKELVLIMKSDVSRIKIEEKRIYLTNANQNLVQNESNK